MSFGVDGGEVNAWADGEEAGVCCACASGKPAIIAIAAIPKTGLNLGFSISRIQYSANSTAWPQGEWRDVSRPVCRSEQPSAAIQESAAACFDGADLRSGSRPKFIDGRLRHFSDQNLYNFCTIGSADWHFWPF